MAKEVSEIWVQFRVDSAQSNTALKTISADLKRLGIDAKVASKAMGEVDSSFKMASGDTTQIVNGINNINAQMEKQISTTERLVQALTKTKTVYKALGNEQKNYSKIADKTLGADARGAAQANRFNSANFLAQFQDIAVTSAMGMNPMLIAMQQGTQLQYILAQSNAPLKDFVAGLKSAFSTAGILTIGLTGLVAALIQTVDWTTVGKTSLNALANIFSFVADNVEVFTIAIGAAATTLILFNGSAITTTIINLGKVGASAVAAGAKMAAGWAMAAAPITLTIGAIAGLIYVFKNFPNEIANALNSAIDFIVGFVNKAIGLFKGLGAVIAELPNLIKDAFENGLTSAKDLAKGTLDFYLNATYIDATGLKDKVTNAIQGTSDVINNVVDGVTNVIKTTADKASEGLNKLSEGLGKTDEKVKKSKSEVDKLAEAWDNLQTSSKNKIEDLQRNISLIGAGTYQSTYEKTLADIIRQAESSGINLTPDKYAELQKDAEGIAELTDEYEKLNDKVNFAKSTVKGFFSDMRQGLKEGESAWEAFGNAVSNVLDKILDKIMDIGVDALFNAGYGYGKSAGWWGSGTQVYSSPIGPTMPGATPLTGAAQGGVFTNGIYSSPTMFKFAKGGKFGVMGEAGPEAVMPLTRNSDGTLGVKATNVGNSSPVVVNVINNSNAQARVEQRETSNGTEIDVMIDQLVAEKMGKPGTSSNSALRAFNNQKLIAR